MNRKRGFPRPAVIAATVLVLAVLVPYWPLTTMQGYAFTDDHAISDLMNEGLPFRHYLGEVLRSGAAPTWIPSMNGGMPLLARTGAGAAYPPNLLLFGLLPSYPALNLSILSTLLVAAGGAYLLARRLGAGRTAALVAGVTFAYCGFIVSHVRHLGMLSTACWLPLGLWTIERAFSPSFVMDAARDGARSAALLWLAPVLALQCLAGHSHVVYISGLAYVAYFVARSVRAAGEGRGRDAGIPYRRAAWFLAALVLGAGAAAVQLLPSYELAGVADRSGGVSFEYASKYAYDPRNALTFLYPYANGDEGAGTYTGSGVFWEDYGYTGLIALLLAVFGAARAWRSFPARFFVPCALVSVLMVLGPNTPAYEAAFHVVPGMGLFRFPTRFMLLVHLSLAVLASLGVDRLLEIAAPSGEPSASPARRVLVGAAVFGLVLADLVYFQLRQNAVVDADAWRETPSTVRIIGENARVREGDGLFRVFSPGAQEAHMLAYETVGGWQGDLQPYVEQREHIQPNTNVLYGLDTPNGYTQLAPEYVTAVWGDQNSPNSGLILETASLRGGRVLVSGAFVRLVSMFNVKYVLSPWSVDGAGFELVERVDVGLPPPFDSVHVYRNPGVLPRAYVVGAFRRVPDDAAARRMLVAPGFDPGREVILFEDPPVTPTATATAATAQVERYANTEVVVRVTCDAPGLLVLADTYYPGWRAEVDGAEVEILRANLCQRAVPVPAGEHRVRFVFESAPVRTGLLISIVSLLATAVLLWAARPRGGSTET